MNKMIPVTVLCFTCGFYLLYLLISKEVSGDDYVFFTLLLFLLPFSLKAFLDYRRLLSKKNNYPIFVRDLTLNIKTGMEPVKAIVLLEKNDYGALSEDVKLLTSNLKLGVPMDHAFDVMTTNIKSRSIRRTVSVISGAIRTGGKMEEVLTILSAYLLNDREMRSEINSKLFTYQLIFIIIFLIYIAMNYFLLSNILPMMNESGFVVDMDFYITLMFRSTMLLAVFMGLVAGKLTKGSLADALPNVFLLVTIGWMFFRTAM